LIDQLTGLADVQVFDAGLAELLHGTLTRIKLLTFAQSKDGPQLTLGNGRYAGSLTGVRDQPLIVATSASRRATGRTSGKSITGLLIVVKQITGLTSAGLMIGRRDQASRVRVTI
jgi:hypothetical protein